MEGTSLNDILLPEEVYERYGSKTTVYVREKAGKFPQRHYLDADSPSPRRPFWLKREIEEWVANQVKQADEARVKAGLIGARLVRARQEKAAR